MMTLSKYYAYSLVIDNNFIGSMSKQTTRSTKKSLGLISDREIELWNSDVKTKSKCMQRNGSKVTGRKNSAINNEEDISIVFDTSLNQLREKTRT